MSLLRLSWSAPSLKSLTSLLSIQTLILAILICAVFPSIDAANVYYEFNVTYGFRSPDCCQRSMLLVNGGSPGPTIYAAQGDTLIITVNNHMESDVTTVHWHGIEQHGSPQMDGTPFVSQDPIFPGQSFVYRMDLDDQVGTYWYHAHVSLQSNTVFGAIIVRESGKDNTRTQAGVRYDDERLLMISDLFHRAEPDLTTGIVNETFSWIGDPASILTNGKTFGDWATGSATPAIQCAIPKPGTCSYDKINVEPGKTYRIRIIGATSLSYVSLSIANHNMTLIEADGSMIEPVQITNLEINSGQRYSVLVTMDQTPQNYVIHAVPKWRPFQAGNGISVLHYSTVPEPELIQTITSGIPTHPSESPNWILPTVQMKKKLPIDNYHYIFPKKVSREFTLTATQQPVDTTVKWFVNGISSKTPSVTLLTHAATAGAGNSVPVIELRNGEVIQLVFQNTVAANGICEQHPWHLHGRSFYDLGYGPGQYNTTTVKEREALLDTQNPVLRDTTTVFPSANAYFQPKTLKPGDKCGWRVIRFKADNPGFWLLHCHITTHMMMGMQVIFRIS
ncbi:hypothetical protein K7432_010820 [Basidiobolus ranarum]|uniref:Laccase n=1 Tax=Basidiobolus ranarum TaxID=34480 RepID=A0ABR2VUY0_9FUNG